MSQILLILFFTLINILVDSDCCMLCYCQEIDRQVPLMDEIDTKVMISLSLYLYIFKYTYIYVS